MPPSRHAASATRPSLAAPLSAPPPGAAPETAVAVGDVAQALREVIESSFAPVWVRGEVSNFLAHRNGHWYFTLKDRTAQLRCVVWARDTQAIPARPDDGMQVVVQGRMGVYTARTEVQLTVRTIQADGDGLWEKALRETRAALEREGLLDPTRRRPIPAHPRTVAVITSPDGAALHDIISVAQRRNPTVQLVLVPAKVQGEGAEASLIAALDRVTRWHHASPGVVDTVIIGRGGGSREDLWAFNGLALARAIARCPVPIISAVGHEVDVAISDLVADLRAATPSAAAEAAVPSRAALQADLRKRAQHLAHIAERRLRLARERQRRAAELLRRASTRLIEVRRARLERLAATLHALSPLAILARGYAVPRDPAGRALRSVSDFQTGTPFRLTVADGDVEAMPLAPHAITVTDPSTPPDHA